MKDSTKTDLELSEAFDKAVAEILPATSGIEEFSPIEDFFLTAIELLNNYRTSRNALCREDKGRVVMTLRENNRFIIIPNEEEKYESALMHGYFASEALKRLFERKQSDLDTAVQEAISRFMKHFEKEIASLEDVTIPYKKLATVLTASVRRRRPAGSVGRAPQPDGRG